MLLNQICLTVVNTTVWLCVSKRNKICNHNNLFCNLHACILMWKDPKKKSQSKLRTRLHARKESESSHTYCSNTFSANTMLDLLQTVAEHCVLIALVCTLGSILWLCIDEHSVCLFCVGKSGPSNPATLTETLGRGFSSTDGQPTICWLLRFMQKIVQKVKFIHQIN